MKTKEYLNGGHFGIRCMEGRLHPPVILTEKCGHPEGDPWVECLSALVAGNDDNGENEALAVSIRRK